jgi:hypothetical protein
MYMSDQPSTFADFSPYLSPWVNDERLARQGIAIVCPVVETWCMGQADALSVRQPAARKLEVEITPRWLTLEGSPQRFIITIVPPRLS